MGLNIPTEISDSFRWGIWLKKLQEAQLALPHTRINWKAKCGRNKCRAVREPPWPTLASKIGQTPLPFCSSVQNISHIYEYIYIYIYIYIYTIVLSSRICQFFCPGVLRCIRDRWRPDKGAIIVHTHAVSSVVVEIDMGGKLKHALWKFHWYEQKENFDTEAEKCYEIWCKCNFKRELWIIDFCWV